jgi:hypothetical protein
MRKPDEIATVRINVIIHQEIDALLEQLAPRLKLTSKTAVLQKAVQILAFIADNDMKFYLERPDGSLREVVII